MEKERMRKKIQALTNLPPLPAVIQKISQMVENPSTTATDLSEIIAKDQSLTAKVLRLVNSPIYGFPGKISSISHAVVLLGFNVVKGLVLGTFVSGMMGKALLGLWEHCLGCSLAAGIIARKINFPNPEEAAVAGLLHDVGKAAIKVTMPEDFKKIISLTKERKLYIIDAEKEVLDNWTHCHVGRELAAKWNLPTTHMEAIAYHHSPRKAQSSAGTADIIHLADILIKAVGFGNSGDRYVPQVDKMLWEKMNLTFDQLEEIAIIVTGDVDRVKNLFSV